MVFGQRRHSPFRSIIVLLVASLLFMGTLVLSVDEICRTDIARRQPFYPDAEMVQQDYNFLRPHAVGTTSTTLYTTDDEETVRQWMRDVTLDLLRREAFHGLATVIWDTQPDPATDGTFIQLYSECGQ